MSASREKDQKDYDLEQIVKIFDTALESDDQRIKDALRALLTITVLCTAEHPQEKIMGPFERMRDDMRHLVRRLSDLEDELRLIKKAAESPARRVNAYGPIPGSSWPSTGYTLGRKC